MAKKLIAVAAAAIGVVCASSGIAVADPVAVAGSSSGMAEAPVAVAAPQMGLIIVNGTLVDARCIAPWSNGSVIGGVIAPNSHYAACNAAPVDQTQNAPYKGGLLF